MSAQNAAPPVHLPAGRYRHYKGNDYEVIGLARHSETEAWLVVYRPLYGDRGLWVRPLLMFTEEVPVGNERLPRFRFVGPMLPEAPSAPASGES